MSFGMPVDPTYVAFRDGVLQANDDVIDKWRWRWNPSHKKWFTYAAADWILDDPSLPDTSPGTGFELIKNDDPSVERARADSWLPDVFARVQAAHQSNASKWPNLVWTWRNGGDWRSAVSRKVAQPSIPGGRGPSDDENGMDPLTPECVQRVKDVREWVRRGVITSVDGQRLIREIVAECT